MLDFERGKGAVIKPNLVEHPLEIKLGGLCGGTELVTLKGRR
jgi:hypothetical protein